MFGQQYDTDQENYNRYNSPDDESRGHHDCSIHQSTVLPVNNVILLKAGQHSISHCHTCVLDKLINKWYCTYIYTYWYILVYMCVSLSNQLPVFWVNSIVYVLHALVYVLETCICTCTHIHTHLNIYHTINTFDMVLSAFNLPCLYKFIFIVWVSVDQVQTCQFYMNEVQTINL